MALVGIGGGTITPVGGFTRGLAYNTVSVGTAQTLAAANAAIVMYGYVVTEDGGSHTIDTTGSSSLGWRSGAVTFANAGTTVLVGLAALDTGTGPPARATNVANVITFGAVKTLVGGGGGITATAWNEHVPSAGTTTVANGAYIAFAIQMTTRGGADSVVVQAASVINAAIEILTCNITTFDGTATYADVSKLPNAVITFSDGTLGFFYGSYVATTGATTQTWNSGSGTVEYGNYFQIPFPTTIYGMIGSVTPTNDFSVVLYSDPLGTPAAQVTVSIDANTTAVATAAPFMVLFPTPYTTTANQPLAGIFKPGASSISAFYKTYNISGHQKTDSLGANCYAVNRASGAFAAQNSNKDRFMLSLLIGSANDSTGGGAGFVSA